MKKLAIALSVMGLAIFTLLMGSDKKSKKDNADIGNLDEGMVGLRGEEIFIGANGGRYFLKDGKKIYVGYKGKKHSS